MRRDLAAVVESRFRTQQEAICQAIGGDADRARGKPIIESGSSLLGAIRLAKVISIPCRGVALQDEAVQGVEGMKF